VQSSAQEDSIYGTDAQALRDAAGVTVVGGIDINSAKEISERAGITPVVTPSRGSGLRSHTEHVQQQETFTIGDQQELGDGQAVIMARGLSPFIAYTPSIWEQRAIRNLITAEAEAVANSVAAMRVFNNENAHLNERKDDVLRPS
jgi:type IV secretory pathway TraG/TraD family ATPase VirD4